MRRAPFLFVLFVALAALRVTAARAQSKPQLQAHADVDTVSVGDVVHLELNAQSGDAMPSDPEPGATPGFTVGRPASSPSQTQMFINGTRIARYGLVVDWPLRAERVGVFSIGPPSVVVGGARYAARSVSVRVVPAGQAPPRPSQPPATQPSQPFGFTPFDAWRGLFPGFPGIDQGSERPDAVPAVTPDPKLALDAPRGPYYFLHATAEPMRAVIGQQVTFTVYEYLDVSAPGNIEVDGTDVHDPSAADFVKHPLLRDDQETLLAGYASVGGHVWKVTVVRRWALFPLHEGDLAIGPMSITLLRPRGASPPKRATEALTVHVTEPPAVGRPPGYALGDVGRFALSAQVTPRELEQGAAVGVHVELSGTGNIPAMLAPPAREGVEWLAPEIHEQVGAVGRDAFGGHRNFDYVVRVQRAGNVDLGEIRLPFWDPEQRKYDTARAVLGAVSVKPSAAAAAAASAAAEHELLGGLPPPRDKLEPTPAAHAHVDDSPLFWWFGVGSWPAVLGIAVAGRAAGRRVYGALTARRGSPHTELKERVHSANMAHRGKDARAADAATARALEAAAVAHAGISVRGAVGDDDVIARLEHAGVARDTASRVAELLRECETARFAPDAADVPAARDRWLRAQGIIRGLEKR
jgi:hypothetical protein